MSNLDNMVENTTKFLESYKSSDALVEDIEALVSIDKNDLDNEITRNPSRFAWVAILAEQADLEEARAKKRYESQEGITNLAVRSGAIALPEGVTKLTEGVVEAMIDSDESLNEHYEAYLEVKHKAGVMKRIVQSLAQKSDMLRTFSSNVRKELESDFDVKKEAAKLVLKKKTSGGDN